MVFKVRVQDLCLGLRVSGVVGLGLRLLLEVHGTWDDNLQP